MKKTERVKEGIKKHAKSMSKTTWKMIRDEPLASFRLAKALYNGLCPECRRPPVQKGDIRYFISVMADDFYFGYIDFQGDLDKASEDVKRRSLEKAVKEEVPLSEEYKKHGYIVGNWKDEKDKRDEKILKKKDKEPIIRPASVECTNHRDKWMKIEAEKHICK